MDGIPDCQYIPQCHSSGRRGRGRGRGRQSGQTRLSKLLPTTVTIFDAVKASLTLMATETRYIYSRHTPERTQDTDEQRHDDAVDPWIAERPFGVNERIARPPRFIAATTNTGLADGERQEVTSATETAGDEGRSWYLSLERRTPSGSSTPSIAKSITATMDPNIPSEQPSRSAKKSDDLWFIRRALESQAREQPEASGSGSSTPTLADILSRDPPPLPSQKRFKPSVWLAVGPGNKGFEMLQKSGWEEGEALGRASRRKARLGCKPTTSTSASTINEEVIDVDEVVDLTLSSDDEDDLSPTLSQLSPRAFSQSQ